MKQFNYIDREPHYSYYRRFLDSDKWGIIDQNGNVIIKAKYFDLYSMNNNFYVASLTNKDSVDKTGIIDINEKIILDFKYNHQYVIENFKKLLRLYKLKTVLYETEN